MMIQNLIDSLITFILKREDCNHMI